MTYLRDNGTGGTQNEQRTLSRAVNIRDILRAVTSPPIADALKPHANLGFINLWDVGARASPFLKEGDVLYIRVETQLYIGTILEKIYDPDGEIGASDVVHWHPITA